MANKFQQKRKRAIIAGIIIAIAISAFVLAEPIKETLYGLPGFSVKAPSGSFVEIPWTQLEKASWEAGGIPVIPDNVSKYAGKNVRISGFMYPMSEHYDNTERIYLAPKPSSCYFCTPPAVNEVIEVNTAKAKKVKVLDNRSIVIYGKFRLAKDAEDSALFYIDDAVVMLKKYFAKKTACAERYSFRTGKNFS